MAKNQAQYFKNLIIIYNKNPNCCKLCLTQLSYKKRINKFCSSSCAALFNNKVKPKRIKKNIKINTGFCLFCKKEFPKNKKYCNAQCQQGFIWSQRKEKILKDGYDDNSRNHHLAKKLLLEQSNNKCNICGLSEWLGQKIPLVLDHINGNSNDGYLSNLRVICNNCDALTPTYKSKNKGNGRHYRRTRYNLGKSY